MELIIGFSRAKSPFAIGSKAIAISEKTNFSHVFIKTNDLETGLIMVYQASHGFVNTITLNNFTVDNIIAKEYTLSVTPQEYTSILIFMKDNLGIPYSRLQLVLIAIKKLFHTELNIRNNSKAEICSEFGARVAKLDGINVGTDLDYETPSDLDKILTLNKIPCKVY